jgi:GrpB-like predicted nucleotidyltransferase (UPF0157 family)
VTLVDYDPGWPEVFGVEAERIRAALGERVRMLEHIGSTSVPGLCAKPVVDILLVLADPADEDGYLPALREAGYRLVIREPGADEHRALKGREGGEPPTVNLHVRPPDSTEVGTCLLFRSWLRRSEQDRERYAAVKRDLAGREWRYIQNYADAKNAVVDEILARAIARRR